MDGNSFGPIVPLGEPAPATTSSRARRSRGAGSMVTRGRGRGAGSSRAVREGDMSMVDAKSKGEGTGRGGRGGLSERLSTRGNRFSPLTKGGEGIAYRSKTGNAPGGTVSSIATLRTFLKSRYVLESRYLDLEDMAGDVALKKAGIRPPGAVASQSSVGPVLSKLISEMFPDVQTISLAKNHFKTLLPVSTLAQYVPNLANLSLQDNDLGDYKDMTPLSGSRGKLAALKELILIGNPVRERAYEKGQAEVYKKEVCNRFPSLTMLDQEPVVPLAPPIIQKPVTAKTSDASPTTTKATFPLSIQPNFFDSDVTKETVSLILTRFFDLYDNQRPSLLDVYHDRATFSMNATFEHPPKSSKGGGAGMPSNSRMRYEDYVDLSRNQMRRGGKAILSTLHTGPQAITQAISKLPSTQHPLTQAGQFSVDAFQVPNLASTGGQISMWITIHGQFTELPSQGQRSFDRSLLLVPSLPDSAAARAGWQCTILSDMLSIRQFSSPQAWASDALDVRPPPTPNNGEEPTRDAKVAILSGETNLKLNFAMQALEENTWNLDLAREAFKRLRDTGGIPPQAFN